MKDLPPAPGKELLSGAGGWGGLGGGGKKGGTMGAVGVSPQTRRRTIVKIKGAGDNRGRSTSPHGGPILKYNDLKRMQQRFENASVTIESILVKKPQGTAAQEGDEDSNNAAAVTSLKIASHLNIWKDDVARLLLLVDSHINRCKKLQDHEVHMSHQNKDSPADVRRKRVNEFVLSLKADLRALHGFISVKALQEEFEANGGVVEEFRPMDVHEDSVVMNTKQYWSEKGLELESKLREIMPIEPSKEKRRRANNGGGDESVDGSQTDGSQMDGTGSLDGSSLDGSSLDGSSLGGEGDGVKSIKASQVLQLYELRQSIMYSIVEHFQRVRDDLETDFDGGTDSAVTTILRSDKDKREMSAYIKSFLKVTEQADEMGHEAIEKFSFTPKAIKEGYIESTKIERLRKEISRIQYEIRKAEHKMAQNKRQKNDYNNVEIRRGLLQRWRVQMDEYESALKTLLARERDREDRAEETAHRAAENHEQNLRKIHPKILDFIEEGYRLKEKLESLLLNVNLTTGLFKKREQKLSDVEQKITKTRSARAQIDLERRKSQLDFATLNVDSKRNTKILEVALKANERAKSIYREHSHTLQDNVQEIENLEGQLDKANKERESYESSLKVKKEALQIKIEEKEGLEATIRRMNSVLVNVANQCDEMMEQFNDQKMLKLKNIITELKIQDRANAKAKDAVDKAKKKIVKLEDFLKVNESKLHGYLAEYDE
ncbi:hypothetical protein TL16_g12133 [Triparma laevis f. inornata]|uniref:Uncharacterized protein n=1 Tax=Triparma laevis f. inornata TaxID=1714386 RepID=A0A9W7ET19_9STRA|nr:hypothetical protein TL16_g12133 [Triparma laevis f. inornata]